MTEKLIVITIKLDYSKVPSKSTVPTHDYNGLASEVTHQAHHKIENDCCEDDDRLQQKYTRILCLEN